MQSLVVVVSLLQTGGSPRVQQDLVHLVVEQLWTTPLIVVVVLVGAPHDSAPHCCCSALAVNEIAKKNAQSKSLVATKTASVMIYHRVSGLRPTQKSLVPTQSFTPQNRCYT